MLFTHRVTRSCILACISSSPLRSDGLSCRSGPFPLLPGYSRHNYPSLMMDGDGRAEGLVEDGLF